MSVQQCSQIDITLGRPLVAVFQATDLSRSLTIDSVNLVGSDGTILNTIDDVILLDEYSFATSLTPPDVLFYWQILGEDEEGYSFSRIGDAAIEVSRIDLILGKMEKLNFYVCIILYMYIWYR